VDHWQEDAHAEGEQIFRALSDYLATHYRSFSSLIRSDFSHARTHFAEGSVDLLHIDGPYWYRAGLANFMSWRSRLSHSGVVLFHGTNARERGVARLWQELIQNHKHFEFVHGSGLGVLGVGDSFPAPLEYLFWSAQKPHVADQIRDAYSLLGSMVSLRSRWGDPHAQLRQHELERAKLTARMADLELELAREATRQAALASMQKAKIATKDKRIECLQQDFECLQLELKRAQGERNSLLNSTSWRITAPIRLIMPILRRAANACKLMV
jgi:hypothetical protein